MFPEKSDIFPFNLAVVINADCDMENGKHDGVLALLPIFRFSEYLEKFWMPHFLENKIKEVSQQIVDISGLNYNNIDEIKRWIASPQSATKFDPDKFVEKLQLSKKQSTAVKEALVFLEYAIQENSNTSLNSLKTFAPKDTVEKSSKFIRTQLISAFKGLGEGHFFISEIKGDTDIGFVVRMRRIYSIEVGKCFLSHSDFNSKGGDSKNCAYRISRFTPSYKFKIAQLFALQFSRIGLPNELTKLSDLAIDNVAEIIN